MPTTINDLYNAELADNTVITTDTAAVATAQAAVVAAQAQLTTDTTKAVNDSKALNAAVVANGPTFLPANADGTLVVLIPAPDGTVAVYTAKPAVTSLVPPVNPTPGPSGS